MAELREAIDQLDAALVALIVRRARYIDRAIALKPAEGIPARAEDRVEEVVSNVRRLAEDSGLDPDLVERIWRDLIEWSIAREARILGA
jgi:isochorismate pyruvate lyase